MKRKIVILILILSVKHAPAQLNLFVRGGFQNNNVKVSLTRTPEDKYWGKWGWCAGGQIEYITPEKVIVFAGAGLSSIRYEQKILHMADADVANYYKLYFLEIPFGFGYQFRPHKKINLNLYGGGYYNVGIAGSNDLFGQAYYFAWGVGYSAYSKTQKIRFGKQEDYGDSFRKTNSGLQTGASIGICNSLYVEFLYKHGISNVLLKSNSEYENRKFRMFALGLKYNFLNLAKEKRSTKASSSDKKAF